ncbi:MAG: hypothetical protein HN423_06630, partial [Alphaproteobacteria bacterium]|nr:hypothetical protein [Alphaproteobacteria bacterium]
MLKKKFQGLEPRIRRFEVAGNGDFVCLAVAGKQVRTLRISGNSVEETEAFALVPRKATTGTKSGKGNRASQIFFINNTAEPVDIFWVDASKVRKKYTTLQPGGTSTQNTYAGHVFIAGNLAFTATEKPAMAYLAAKETPAPPPAKASYDWSAKFRKTNLFASLRGKETQLTTDGSKDWSYCGPLHWSPDGSHLVAMREKKGTNRHIDLVEAAPKDQLQPKTISIRYPKPGDELDVKKPHLFDLQTGTEIPLDDALFSNPWNLTKFHWSPDGEQFFFLYNERGHQTLRLIAVQAATGKAATVLEETSPTFIDYSQKLHLTYIDETDEAIWMSERSGWNHLYLVDLKTGATDPITTGEWVVRAVDRIDAEKRQIWFQAGGIHPSQDPYYVHHARINFDGTGLVLLTEGNGTHEVNFSKDWKFYTDTWSRTDQPPVHELRRSSDGRKVADIGRADATKLLAVHPHLPEPFAAKGRDGTTDIFGVIFRPTHFDPEKNYPVVEAIYAGPHGQFVPKGF